MKPYLTKASAVCYILLIIGGHVNALPIHNQLVSREDFPILKKSLYTRADEVNLGHTEGPGTDGEAQQKKTKLNADADRLAVSSETGTPKPQKPLLNPSVGQPAPSTISPPSSSQLQHVNPTTSESAPSGTLDPAITNARKVALEHLNTITDLEAKKLQRTIIDAQFETDLLPWKQERVWSDDVLRVMIQVLRRQEARVIRSKYTKDRKEAQREGRKNSKPVGKMARPDLEVEMDKLWRWRVQWNYESTPESSSQMELIKIKEGKLVVEDKRLLRLLFRNGPKDTSEMSRMPWREGKFQWKSEWVEALLMHIWSRQCRWNKRLFEEPGARFSEISSLKGEDREAAIKNAMDDAWKWWEDVVRPVNIRTWEKYSDKTRRNK